MLDENAHYLTECSAFYIKNKIDSMAMTVYKHLLSIYTLIDLKKEILNTQIKMVILYNRAHYFKEAEKYGTQILRETLITAENKESCSKLLYNVLSTLQEILKETDSRKKIIAIQEKAKTLLSENSSLLTSSILSKFSSIFSINPYEEEEFTPSTAFYCTLS